MTLVSILSIVVPGRSETIALFSLATEFKKVDLPEFGLPTIAILRLSLFTEASCGVMYSFIFFLISSMPMECSALIINLFKYPFF